MTRRILITGSRDWTDRETLEAALDAEAATHPDMILCQGDCPTGADRMGLEWAIRESITHEDVPADWERPCDENCYHKPRTKNGKPYCPMAGHLRNQVMVDRGADRCLAFPMPESRGTKDCMRRARKAGIPVTVFTP